MFCLTWVEPAVDLSLNLNYLRLTATKRCWRKVNDLKTVSDRLNLVHSLKHGFHWQAQQHQSSWKDHRKQLQRMIANLFFFWLTAPHHPAKSTTHLEEAGAPLSNFTMKRYQWFVQYTCDTLPIKSESLHMIAFLQVVLYRGKITNVESLSKCLSTYRNCILHEIVMIEINFSLLL